MPSVAWVYGAPDDSTEPGGLPCLGGAPFTFDAEGFASCLANVRQQLAEGNSVSVPTFDHEEGDPKADGLTIDGATRVWQGGKAAGLDALVSGQIVQLNLTWAPGWRDDEFCVADIWLDEESQESATELQRRRHIRYQRYHWLAGWVDSVEHRDIGGGVLSITFFGGMDPSLYSEFRDKGAKGIGVAVAETTLRTYWHNNDKKFGKMVGWKEIADPPHGSSGYQIQILMQELLNGYRPGRMVRMQCRDWGYFRLPSEERLKTIDERDEAATLGFPK